MSEWIDFERWPQCAEMERAGYVFEVADDKDRRMLTHCVVPLELPFDWPAPPVRFRLVVEPAPRHSSPIPAPVEKE